MRQVRIAAHLIFKPVHDYTTLLQNNTVPKGQDHPRFLSHVGSWAER
jgi:hypothetical protein